jgi:steroid delta-isomerase-like uncharacterized protein
MTTNRPTDVPPTDTPSIDRTELLRKWAEAIHTHDTPGWVACYTETADIDDVTFSHFYDQEFGHWHGHEEFTEWGDDWFASVPDLYFTIERHFSEGNLTTAVWRCGGTYQGDIPGFPRESAKGALFTVPGVSILELAADGRIQRETLYWDMAFMLRQLGVLQPAARVS